MIIENTGIKGLQSELGHLDEAATAVGFFRWQWEYYRATYDMKLIDNTDEYFLRFNARVTEGKMESKQAVLCMEDAYIGRATFHHGLDYNSEVPKSIMDLAGKKLALLKDQLI